MPASARLILANTTYRLVADIGAKIASVALFVVMARRLGEAGFGLFSFALALTMLVTAAADFGQDKVLTREVARRPAALDGYLANTLALKLALAVPGLAVAIAIVAATGADSTTLVAVLLLGLAVIADLLTATCFAVYQAFERMAYIPIVLITQRFVTAVAGIVALLLGAGVATVAAIFFVSGALGFGIALGLLLGRLARPRLEVRPRMWKALMRAAAPIGLAGLFGIVLFRIDTVMLAAFEPEEVVGQYGAAYRLFETTLFLSWAVGAAVYPVFSRSSRTSEPPVGGVYERSIKLVVALTLPLAVGAALLAEPLTAPDDPLGHAFQRIDPNGRSFQVLGGPDATVASRDRDHVCVLWILQLVVGRRNDLDRQALRLGDHDGDDPRVAEIERTALHTCRHLGAALGQLRPDLDSLLSEEAFLPTQEQGSGAGDRKRPNVDARRSAFPSTTASIIIAPAGDRAQGQHERGQDWPRLP